MVLVCMLQSLSLSSVCDQTVRRTNLRTHVCSVHEFLLPIGEGYLRGRAHRKTWGTHNQAARQTSTQGHRRTGKQGGAQEDRQAGRGTGGQASREGEGGRLLGREPGSQTRV